MHHRPKKQPQTIKKILAVVSALSFAICGVVKLIKDNAAEKNAAVVSANER
jgi:hypothetical protein